MTGRPSGQHPCGQYLAGLCFAGLGVCAAGWLVVTALAFAGPVSGTPDGKWNDAAVTTLATGAGLALVATITFACWARAWHRLLLADGVLVWKAGHRSRRRARRPRQTGVRVARERAQRVSLDQSSGDATGSDSEPEPVRPANADRVLSGLRDQLGPLVTALNTTESPAAAPPAQDPSVVLSPAAPGTAPVSAAAPGTARAAQQATHPDSCAGPVVVGADGMTSHDPEEDW